MDPAPPGAPHPRRGDRHGAHRLRIGARRREQLTAARSPAAALRAHALALPGAWADTPWEGDNVAKVGRKIFAFLPSDPRASLGVKLPVSGGFALSLRCATPMAYGLGRHGWVTVQLGDPSAPDVEVLCEWVTESYRAVATKTLVKQLDASSPDSHSELGQ